MLVVVRMIAAMRIVVAIGICLYKTIYSKAHVSALALALTAEKETNIFSFVVNNSQIT